MTTFNHHNTIVNPRHPWAEGFSLEVFANAGWTIEQLIDIEYLIPIQTILDYSLGQYLNEFKANGERLHIAGMSKLYEDGAITRNDFELCLHEHVENYLNREGSQFKVAPAPKNDDLFKTLSKAGKEAKLAGDKLTGCADKLAGCADNISKQMLGRIRRFPHDELADYAFEQKKVDSLMQDRTNTFKPRKAIFINAPINNELLNDDRISELLSKLWHFTPLGSSVKRHNPDPFTEHHWFKGCGYRLKVRPTVLATGERIHVVIDDDVFSNYELSVAYKELEFNQ